MLLRSSIAASIALAVMVAAIDAAQAKPHPSVRYCGRVNAWGWNGRVAQCQPRLVKPRATTVDVWARPRRWCGWFARQMVGQDPGPVFNLARAWSRWGRPAGGPGVGVMVVWPHHVGLITGRAPDGQWIVKSGNDGHSVRERPRSLAGAIAFRVG